MPKTADISMEKPAALKNLNKLVSRSAVCPLALSILQRYQATSRAPLRNLTGKVVADLRGITFKINGYAMVYSGLRRSDANKLRDAKAGAVITFHDFLPMTYSSRMPSVFAEKNNHGSVTILRIMLQPNDSVIPVGAVLTACNKKNIFPEEGEYLLDRGVSLHIVHTVYSSGMTEVYATLQAPKPFAIQTIKRHVEHMKRERMKRESGNVLIMP